MPKQSAARYRVVKDFDFHPRPGVVMAFRAGEERAGLTKAQIERGQSLGALEPIASKQE
ncbi:MAG: hypothetical protein Q4G36_08210 [Paracoccus sp. (in: a-proteobacteria)]|nr:hypothetical protein [Paracoccus sp. (in: a-proteobacteria)]